MDWNSQGSKTAQSKTVSCAAKQIKLTPVNVKFHLVNDALFRDLPAPTQQILDASLSCLTCVRHLVVKETYNDTPKKIQREKRLSNGLPIKVAANQRH